MFDKWVNKEYMKTLSIMAQNNQSTALRRTEALAGHLAASSPPVTSSISSVVKELNSEPRPQHLKYFPKYEPFNPHRPVKAIIVGAGIAGLAAAVLIPNKVKNLSYVVYEKNYTVGGTWANNIYPGVRCDVPSHLYQLPSVPNPNWTEYYPKGAETRQYYEKVVKDHKIDEHLRLKHEILAARWDAPTSEWEVQVKNLVTEDIFTDRANFFISAQGRLNKWAYPDIPGLQTRYKGKLMHSSAYDSSFDHAGKTIAIIGNGASGQQLVPNLISKAAHIDHYIRSKTWVTPRFTGDLLIATAEQPGGPVYSEEQKKEWIEKPETYLNFRRQLERNMHGRFQGGIKGSPENEAFRKLCIDTMLERLDGDEEWLKKIIPGYAPGCKRPTPAPGYIEALRSPKLDFVTEPIIEATETGLVTADGKHREVDTILAATGFTGTFVPRFPTIGEDGSDLAHLWSKQGPTGYPDTYFGVMAPNFPNYFFILQAQRTAGGGTVPMQCEISATYIAKAIRKVQSQSYKALRPSQEATDYFNQIVEGYFDDKVTTDSCSSWFKVGKGRSRVVVGWPGTGHHRFDILRDPRWEDFIFDRADDAKANPYEYFGNGWTERERGGDKVELSKYLLEVGKIDLATVHESWNL